MNMRRITYVQRFKLTLRQACDLDVQFLDQLDACKEDAARRLLLGVSGKKNAAECIEERQTA